MNLRATALWVVVSCLVASGTGHAQVRLRVGPTIGYSMIEQTDEGNSHGPLTEAITFGRSWLVGGVVDVQFAKQEHLAFEVVYGPYGDTYRYCIDYATGSCPEEIGGAVSGSVFYGGSYIRNWGRGAWQPYVAGGIGLKQYWFDRFGKSDSSVGYVFSGGGGVESTGRHPVRLELRAVFITAHPLAGAPYRQAHPFELHANLTVLMGGRAR